jgi:hypothetical protein
MIIGLTGYKGSGKSTAAKYLEEKYGFKRVNFKDGLVAEMKERLPDVLEQLSKYHHLSVDELFNIKPEIMRALMQNYGTEVRRADDPDYWVNKWNKTVSGNDVNIVVDDVRFGNERDALLMQEGVLIRITRLDITSGGEHQSETEQEGFEADFTIVAEPGSFESIYKQIDSIIETIKSNHD